MAHANLEREKADLLTQAKKDLLDDDGNLKQPPNPSNPNPNDTSESDPSKAKRRKRRWDDSTSKAANNNTPQTTDANPKPDLAVVSDTESTTASISTKATNKSRWDDDTSTASSLIFTLFSIIKLLECR